MVQDFYGLKILRNNIHFFRFDFIGRKICILNDLFGFTREIREERHIYRRGRLAGQTVEFCIGRDNAALNKCRQFRSPLDNIRVKQCWYNYI